MKRLLLCYLALALLSGSALIAQVPQTMSYQGVLVDESGVAVPDGSYDIVFGLYDNSAGGTQVWTETLPVTVAKGVFSIVLGTINPISTAFDRPYWLGLAIEGGAELSPRTRLTASPYSLMAQEVADGAVTGGSIAGGQVVKSVNTLKDDVTLAAGSNVTITPSGNTLTIAAADGDGGDITSVSAGTGLSGGGGSGDVTLSVVVPLSLTYSASVAPIQGYNNGTGSGVRGSNIGGNYGYLGSNTYGVYGWAFGSNRAVTGSHGNNNYGELGTEDCGVYGQNSAGTYGNIGSSISGVFGMHSSGNYGYLGRDTYGVEGYSAGGNGVRGWSDTGYGVYAQSASGAGCWGSNNGSLNYGYLGSDDYGVYGSNSASGCYGYIGSASYGVYGEDSNGNAGFLGAGLDAVYGTTYSGRGVYGVATTGEGVEGRHLQSGNYGQLGTGNYGVFGESEDNYGVRGISSTSYGMYATSTSSAAVRAIRTGGGDYAGRFSGNVEVTGTLSKGGGSFKIDHPLDPQNKYLYHSFVESPDMMNIYNGNTALDGRGEAWVELPEWFEALNGDFRYQLTAIGAPGPNLHIAERIAGNRFRIAGGSAGMEVSWQVTGVRRDPFAQAHRIEVEADKPQEERGKYLYAREYGEPESMGVEYEEMQKMEDEIRTNGERRRLEQERLKVENAAVPRRR